MQYLLLFLGGGLGAVSRFALSSFINQRMNLLFPIGTISVNVIGSFVMGFVFYLFQNVTIAVETRIFITVGFLGGFTTFSSFSIETISLLRDGEYRFFVYNLLFSNLFCLLAAFGGLSIAKIVTR